MTGPEQDRTGEHEAVEPEVVERPSVSTAPASGGRARRWSAIPSHLGRARTSTVVLGLLFVALFGLYLNVRPDPAPTTTGDETSVTEPAPTTGSSTTAETTPAPPSEAPPTTTGGTVPTTGPTEETPPEPTTGSLPTTAEPPTEPTSVPPAPTTASPTG